MLIKIKYLHFFFKEVFREVKIPGSLICEKNINYGKFFWLILNILISCLKCLKCTLLTSIYPDRKNSVEHFYHQSGPDGRCFLAAGAVSKSVLGVKHDRPKPNLPKRKGIHPFRCLARICQSANVLFRTGQFIKNALFMAHCQQVPKTTILQLNIEGLTASKMNVLHYLALQSEALVIPLQETHCTDAEKLVLPSYQLAGSSLSRKHGLAKFVHERLRYMLLDQSPPTSEISGWRGR